jgi:hypothetical protein
VGKARVVSGYVLACTVAGTSGSVAPTLKNYGLNIVDGTVTWQLLAPATYAGILLGTGSNENHLVQCDFSGAFSLSVSIQSTVATTYLTNCVMSAPISLQTGNWTSITNCELGGDITIQGSYAGRTLIQGNFGVTGAINILVGSNVNNFVIADNLLNGGTITVAAGTSDRHRIHGNPNCTIVDSGTGTDKVVVTKFGALVASPAGGTGYTTGAGGTVLQSTSKSTGVTLNTVTGAITMHNAALAAATIVSFVFTIGAVAISRTGDPATGDFIDAKVIRTFGDVPDDLSTL